MLAETPGAVIEIYNRTARIPIEQEIQREFALQHKTRPNLHFVATFYDYLVRHIRKKYITPMQEVRLANVAKVFLTQYTTFLATRMGVDPTAALATVQDLDAAERSAIVARMQALHELGVFPPELAASVSAELAKFAAPLSSQEIAEVAADLNADQVADYSNEYDKMMAKLEEKPPRADKPVNLLGTPADPSLVSIKMDNAIYPSILHFVYSQAMRPITSAKERAGLASVPSNQLKEILIQKAKHYYLGIVQNAARVALHARFSLNSMQNLLLLSGNKSLVYAAEDDLLLGHFNGRGENLWGVLLQSLRDSLRNQLQLPPLVQDRNLLKAQYVQPLRLPKGFEVPSSALQGQLEAWGRVRLNEFFNTLATLRIYLADKYGKGMYLNNNSVNAVINIFYSDCSHLAIGGHIMNSAAYDTAQKEMERKYNLLAEDGGRITELYIFINILLSSAADRSENTPFDVFLRSLDSPLDANCIAFSPDTRLNCALEAMFTIFTMLYNLHPTPRFTVGEQELVAAAKLLLGAYTVIPIVDDEDSHTKKIQEIGQQILDLQIPNDIARKMEYIAKHIVSQLDPSLQNKIRFYTGRPGIRISPAQSNMILIEEIETVYPDETPLVFETGVEDVVDDDEYEQSFNPETDQPEDVPLADEIEADLIEFDETD
jgi:predicted NAD-dependent protein-ADP-ribosyltransferase YbiA (DUF1768 family)